MQPYSGRVDANSLMRSGGTAAIPEDLSELVLAPGFLLGLNVLDEPDLQGTFRVDHDGNIEFPVIGSFKAAGRTVPDLRRDISKKLLDDKIMNAPMVTLSVLEYAAPQVTIVGEVTSPGRYPLLAPHSMIDVLALAGGPTPAAGDKVEITRAASPKSPPELVHYSRDAATQSVNDIVVHPGDTVKVRRAGIVYVLGAVNRPGGYVMQEEGTLTVLQAVSLANGTSPIAASGTIHVIRPNDDGSVVDIPVSYKRLTAGKTAPFLLQAKDVVYVPTNKLKSLFVNGSGVIASTGSAAIYRF